MSRGAISARFCAILVRLILPLAIGGLRIFERKKFTCIVPFVSVQKSIIPL